MANAESGIFAVGNMGLHDPSVPSSDVLASNQDPIYVKYRELGEGAFGKVRIVVDASTGDEYAGKEFFHKTGWEREIEIMERLHHENIVQFIDFRPQPKPLLVMEYLPLGNLGEQNIDSPLAVEEMMVLMYQGLSVLAFLHGNNITHRDLKPGNFLVYSRPPFSVKLCDFGLARDKSVLQTFCGSAQYMAPEVFDNSSYTSAVDVWSLAVILMEYIYGLPRMQELPKLKELAAWGLSWCRRIITAAENWDSDSLIDFLTGHMLRLEPHDRLPAADCLRRGSELGLFDGAFSKTGHATPRLQPVPAAGEIDQDDQSTIIMSRLWEDTSSGVSRRGESAIQSLNIVQTVSLPKDTPMFIMSSISQRLDGSNEGQSSREDIGVPVRKIRASNPAKRRRTSRQDQVPSLPSLPPNEIDACGSFNLLISLGDYAILNLVKSDAERQSILNSWSEHEDPKARRIPQEGFWVTFETGKSLCQILNLEHELRPLLDLGIKGRTVADTPSADSEGKGKYFRLELDGRYITGRRSDFRVNATNILRAASRNRQKVSTFKALHPDMNFATVEGDAQTQGTYVSFLDGLLLCREHQLQELCQLLLQEFVTWMYYADSRDVSDSCIRTSTNPPDRGANPHTYAWDQTRQSHLSQVYPNLGRDTSPPNYADSNGGEPAGDELRHQPLIQPSLNVGCESGCKAAPQPLKAQVDNHGKITQPELAIEIFDGAIPQQRRKRITSPCDLAVLEARYHENPNLTATEYDDLTQQVTLDRRQVVIWFRNRRARDRQKTVKRQPSDQRNRFDGTSQFGFRLGPVEPEALELNLYHL